MKKLVSLLTMWVVFIATAVAQNKIPISSNDYSNNSIEMADAFRSNGKIYVVVGVIVALWAGMMVYLISTDKKISKLEKLLNN
ncbi:CcmD family protein [Flammeovirga pectinis]|nr:CcmD family protein [Flammeovirga pectinis]